ncbi:MAG TPA: RNA pyrophosphohydrolase [Verrucomicrobiales bacterium]|nr:RNA pyrophosphohydrolase [Verrucomicrobiales bacterium]
MSDPSTRPPVEKFRPCVACLMVNEEGKLLICERRDFADSWQFPQGGRDFGETPRQALARELLEEISVSPSHYTVVEERGGYRYRFPVRHRRRGRYVGQQQIYFRCLFRGSDSLINLETKHPEFRSFRWIKPAEFDLRWLPEFKRSVYLNVMRDFFGVEPVGGDAAAIA